MNVKVEKIEKNVVALEIEIEQAQFDSGMEKAYQKVSKKVTVPGFRKGKAPRALIERHVGKEYLKEEALDFIVPEAYMQAIKETGLEPIDRPQVDLVQMEEGKPLIFKATVEVKPEVQLGQYIGLEATKQETEITDQEIDEEIQKLRQRHAQMVNLEEGTAELKDITMIDFEGFVDGTAFPGGAGTEYSLELGSGSFIPGFEEQLIGVKAGETKEVNVTFPENYHSADLAGKAAMFKITVKSIKRKELAELDDEFAKDVSEFETLQELKDDLLNRLKEAAQEKNNNAVKDELVDKVVEVSVVDVPNIMVEQKIDNMVQSFSQRLVMQGLKLEDYLKWNNSDMETVRKDYRQSAEKAVKIDLVLEAIAEKESIAATDEDIDSKAEEMAKRYNSTPDMFRQWLESGGNLENLKKSIIIDKTVDFLQEKAILK
jgi:trigger factor